MRWIYETIKGVAEIVKKKNRFHVIFDGEDLGNYPNQHQAIDDLCGGHTYFPSSGVDPSTLGIPDDLSEWEFFSR